MKIEKQFRVLSLAVFAAMAFAAVGSSLRRSAKPTPGYEQFAECPSEILEYVSSTFKGIREKVTFQQIILGRDCYVGYEKSSLSTAELLVAAIDGGGTKPNFSEASLENNDPIKSFHALSQIKNHLA